MKRLLKACLLPAFFGLCAALWAAETGAPRWLVGVFDGAWDPALPLDPSEHLEVTLPGQVRAGEVERLAEALRARARGVAEVVSGASSHELRLVPAVVRGVVASREAVERLVRPGGGSFEIVPVLADGGAWRRFADEALGPEVYSSEGDLLEATDEQALRSAVAKGLRECGACALAHDEAIVFESLALRAGLPETRWRALRVSRRPPMVDARHVASAELTYDELNRPAVLVSLSDEGGRLFAKLTRDHLDERLAIVLGDRVLMAPYVRSEIHGGQLQVTMGGTTLEQDLATANALMDVVRPGLTLPETTTTRWRTHPGASATARSLGLAAWLVLAMLAGLLLQLAGREVAARVGLEAAPSAFAGSLEGSELAGAIGRQRGGGLGIAAARLALTAALAAAPWLLARVPLPMVDPDALPPSLELSVATLGLIPLLLGHLLVSLVVWLVPRLAPLRTGSFGARRRLRPATALTVLALAVLQALGLMLYLRSMPGLVEEGALPAIAIIATLSLSVFALWGVAGLIGALALGQGIPMLLLGSLVLGALSAPATIAGGDLRLVAAALGLGVLTVLLTNHGVMAGRAVPDRADDARRLPLAGFTPLDLVATLLAVSGLLSPWLDLGALGEGLGIPAQVALVVAAGALLSWLVARPLSPRALLVGAVPGIALLLAVVLAHHALGGSALGLGLPSFLTLVALPVLLADLGTELVATTRLGRLSRVASVHSPDEAARLGRVLAAAGVPVALRGARYRALTRFMGPFAPVEVLVPLPQRALALAALRAEAQAPWVAPFDD